MIYNTLKKLFYFAGTLWEKLELEDFPMVSIANVFVMNMFQFLKLHIINIIYNLGLSRLEYKNSYKKEPK